MNRASRFVTLLPPGLCLLLVGGLIFRKFLFGGEVLLYTDIGSDSVVLFYTEFVHLSNYIRSQGFPSWSFYVGMGQDLAYATGYLVWHPVSWLPSRLIAPALIYQHLGKVLLAGLFFFRFLQLRRLPSPVPLLGSLFLSFSAYMCIGSCWFPFADEVVGFAAILLGTEMAVQRGRWLVLALAVALIGMITPFLLYLCALFLISYVPLRLFGHCGWQPRIILLTCLKLAAVTVLGAGLGAIVTLPCLHDVLNSPRGSGITSVAATLRSLPVFRLETSLHYVTVTLRSFSNDMLGTGSDFHSWQNYLEAPLTYCGLLCLLLLPQVFLGGTRRDKIIYTLFLVGMLVPTVFPWFRYCFWLFQGDYYRTYSLFWILGVISLSLLTLSRYIEGRTINLWLLGTTTVLLAGTLYLPFEPWHTLINPDLRSRAVMFLCLYGVLLTVGQLVTKQRLAAWLVVGLSAIELIQFDRLTVSNRGMLERGRLADFSRVDSSDKAIEALRKITADDNEKFFRITKLRPSGPDVVFTLNDAMLYGYYGTSSYRSFNNVNYTNFLTAVNAISPQSEVATRWSTGLLHSPMLSVFAGEKYVLVDNPLPFENIAQYELVQRDESDYLFRNTKSLPLGLTFDRYVTEDAFLELSADAKAAALLQAVVLSNEREGEKHGLTRIDLEPDSRGDSFAEMVAARRKTALELTSFGQTRIEGNVFLERRSILVLQTPFDRGWHARQDGRVMPVQRVDVGLLGVGLDAGRHKVELHYRNPFLVAATVVTLASFLFLGVGLWRWPRLTLPP